MKQDLTKIKAKLAQLESKLSSTQRTWQAVGDELEAIKDGMEELSELITGPKQKNGISSAPNKKSANG